MTEVLYTRPEIVRGDGKKDFLQVEKTLSAFERIYRIGAVRKAFILFVLAAAWEIYGRWLGNPLLFPSFSQTFAAFSSNIADGTIPARALALCWPRS
jgi:NitT/TauT family transport system permease protein